MQEDVRSDEELAQRARGGDEQAYAGLYHRYFPRIYDYALRLTRDRDVAALVVQASFLRTHQVLVGPQPPVSYKIELFSHAHNEVRERQRRQRGEALEGDEAFSVGEPALLADPSHAADLPELARYAWQVAREMNASDYELLDLSGRQQ